MHHILIGDCRETLLDLPDASVDSVVTDPPYELGFMGKGWDSAGVSFEPATWRHVLRVLKPGGHLVAFGGTRTFHRIAVAIEDAGFQVRDCLSWLYGSGFPKSLNVSKELDRIAGAERPVIGRRTDGARSNGTLVSMNASPQKYDETAPATAAAAQWDGWGTALKPAWEPIILARKPLVGTVAANVLGWGTGAMNVDGCRIARPVAGRWPANVLLDEEAAAQLDAMSGDRPGMSGGGKHKGPGGMFGAIDGNETHIRSDNGGASRFFYTAKTSAKEREAGLNHLPKHGAAELTDREPDTAGLSSPRAGAGRTSKGRANVHPTVKPIALMRWLVRLVTPPGGLVLDPFMGSGSTGCAAVLEGMHFLGCELTEEYVPIAEARIEHWSKL